MIIVTGASGQLGRAVLERLLDRVPADRVGASVRDPGKVADLAARGVRVRRGDYTDTASLAEAFEGASQVLVVSANVLGEEALRQHRTAIEAAVAAGADRVLYTAHMGASPTSPMPPMPDHFATEAILRGSGAAWTSLRNGFYASTVPMLLQSAWHTGEFRTPEAGTVAWTTHGDLADVTALALTTDTFDGLTPPLTGPEALSMEQVAALASQAAGRTIRHVTVSDDDYRADLVGHGVPETAADMLLTMFAASRRGDFEPADPTLARLLGRPATPLSTVLDSAVPAQT
ncbi:NmrA family transcriptional regulator [Actinomycetospora sp. NBRC 106375]|uniref:NmrA family NAD(P)-binding protein n=1 Tax=Actinomycetospora sp. NBRC 106375 TaxID=3032207 RepID=UPI0024A51B56|nr:NAD(P)H-binding protein [Actinomycetospora sp. NBRC 106375]GLZ45881.1 NmrA family transcriptional regulator [Actinomycetospora sp. NBRC 106375]